MLTSDCPGSAELKQMLQETADRVGATLAMLVTSDGCLEACSGHHDLFTVESIASDAAQTDRWQYENDRSPEQARVYVDTCTEEDLARLYVHRITGERYLVTVFERDDGDVGTACIGSDPDAPSLDVAAKLREDMR